MKNYYLYVKTNENIVPADTLPEGIFTFDSCPLLLMDISRFTDRDERFHLQQQYGILPYYITQPVFQEILYFCEHYNDLILCSIRFKNSSMEDTGAYHALVTALEEWNSRDIAQKIADISSAYDTDLQQVDIRYEGYRFGLSSEGVLETDAPEMIFAYFLRDCNVNRLITGQNV